MEKEKHDQIDPDYASYNIALKKVEQIKDDQDTRIEQVKEIINQEFNKDLKMRENQIQFIEDQIYKTQKLLHLMRYVLVSSYYGEKGLEYSEEETPSSSDNGYLFDQNRIHPAVKKLIGKDLSSLNFTKNRTPRKAKVNNNFGTSTSSEDLNSEHSMRVSEINRRDNESVKSEIDNNISSDRYRQKFKKRIIVGNISRWTPSQEDDNLTHKWMMYVRGPKDSPDVSSFIQKVVFYLHPSYKPHDVVEVCGPQFHLSRRGWGEFPIRVQIFFTCPLNKPVDIVHNLKLDKTYSGRTTLGNETLIDLYLYEENVSQFLENESKYQPNKIENNFDNKHQTLIKTEPFDFNFKEESESKNIFHCDMTSEPLLEPKKELFDFDDSTFISSFSSLEHDYCSDGGTLKNGFNDTKDDKTEENISTVNLEHSYSCISSTEPIKQTIKSEPQPQEENSLMYGLDESYAKPDEDLTKREPLFYRKTLIYTPPLNSLKKSEPNKNLSHVKTILNNKLKKNGEQNVAAESKTNKKYSDSNDDQIKDNTLRMAVKRFGIRLPKKFRNVAEALPFLFMRLPPITFKAEDPLYKQLYPFTAASVKEFLSWNTAKLASAEFSRAKTIHNILTKENIYDHERWTVKTVMMYGRSHGYMPIKSWKSFNKNSEERKIISSAFAMLPPKIETQNHINLNVEHPVDVENNTDHLPEAKRPKLSMLDISKPSLAPHCSFIREEALNCGVVLKNEEIIDGVVLNGAERMILEAVKCLANHLVRRSLHYSIYDGTYRQGEGQSTGEIKVHHVQEALNERKEINAIKEFKEKQLKIFYYLE